MRCRREAERLRLRIVLGMQVRLDLAITDDDHGEDEAKDRGAHSDHAREADCLEHDVAKTGKFVRLDDFHYDRRAWRLHRTIVQHG